MRLEHQEIKIEDVISYFVKGFAFKEGETLHNHDFLYDPNKGKVMLKLYVNETGENE